MGSNELFMFIALGVGIILVLVLMFLVALMRIAKNTDPGRHKTEKEGKKPKDETYPDPTKRQQW